MNMTMYELLAAIDANFNRSMEGLRVCEDVCRFGLHNEELSKRAKEYRHALVGLSSQWLKIDLLSARDVAADPIKFTETQEQNSTIAENRSMEALFLRNIRRAIEAVRSLEECAKLDNKNFSSFQSLRFNLYAFEKEVFCAIGRKTIMQNFHNALYAILDPAFAGDDLPAAAHALIKGGVRIIQLRMKNAASKEIIDIAHTICPLCKEKGVIFIVNDRPDIARCVNADGVHVGQDDLSVADARRVMASGKIVGRSTHSYAEAQKAMMENPDYIAIGPVFATSSKYGSEMKGIGIDEVRRVHRAVSLPIVAIGGVSAENVEVLTKEGIKCVAVMSALFKGDIVKNCREITSKLSENK